MPPAAKHKRSRATLLNDYHLLAFDTLDSTNEEAKRLAKGGGCHGAVIWAKEQTAGKGRMGRVWESQTGNLFVSILLAPDKALDALPQLSFVSAIAAIDTLKGIIDDNDLKCKWPNDIILKDKKCGGILLESFKTPEDNKQWVVVGIGINIDHFPTDTHFPATCLKEAGVELISAKIILSRFIHHFIERYNIWDNKGFSLIRKDWLANAWQLQSAVTLRLPNEEVQGIFTGIDTAGNLQLTLPDGVRRVLNTGDVFRCETTDA